MDVILVPVLRVILIALDFYKFFLYAFVIIGWLGLFRIINQNNPFVYKVYQILNKVVSPILLPIRKILPSSLPIDLSPIILLLGIFFFEQMIIRILMRFPL